MAPSQANQDVSNEQLLRQARRAQKTAEALHQATLALSDSLDLDATLEALFDCLSALVPYDSATVMLLEGEDRLSARAVRGYERFCDPALASAVSFEFRGMPHLVRVIDRRESLLIPDTELSSDWVRVPSGAHIRSYLAVALVASGRVIGMYSLDKAEPNFFNDEHRQLAEAVAANAAAAIHNARLFRDTQDARATAEILRSANMALTQGLALDTVLETLFDYLAKLVPYDSATVMLLEGEKRLTARAVRGYERFCDPALARAVSFDFTGMPHLRDVIREQRSLLIPETHGHPYWRVVPSSAHIRCYLGVALVAGGRAIGMYSLDKAEPNFFTDEHRQLAEALAAQAAVAIQNAALFERASAALRQTEARARELETLNRVAQTVNSTLDLHQILDVAAREVLVQLNARSCGVTLFDPERAELKVVAYATRGPELSVVGVSIPLEGNVGTQRVIETRRSLVLTDAQNTPLQSDATRAMMRARGVECLLITPLVVRDEVIGTIGPDTDQADRVFTRDDVRLAETIASQVARAIENARLYQTLEQRVADRTREAQEARHVAERANQAKSTFLATMSHELRTPLNGILGFAQALQRDTRLGSAQREGVDIICSSGRHLLTLINDVLDLAKIEAGRMDLYPTELTLPAFLEDVAEVTRVHARQKGLVLSCLPVAGLPARVLADEKRLRQVLLNLLANAVKFTSHGQVELNVVVLGPEPEGTRLRFTVSDTGTGIAASDLEGIFQPFQQTGAARERAAGTGLGLTISRQIVSLMGGRIEVASEPGRGSRFWFEVVLPVVAGQDPARAEARPAIRGYRGERRLVLVVDDRLQNCQVIQALLEPLGFPVATAASGEEGLERARALRPALVLMDLLMPGISGIEAIASIRREPELAGVAIVATSASSTETEQERCREAGCDGFLPKPVDADRMFELIGRLLGLEWECEEVAALDAGAARAALDVAARLGEQIAANNLGASSSFVELRTALGPRYPGEVAALAACLDRLDFPGATAPLGQIRSALSRVAEEA